MEKLLEINTGAPDHIDKDQIKQRTEEYLKELGRLQMQLFASQHKAVLVVLQGMDTAGKDSTIRKVFTGVNPMGCNVYSWKKPHEFEERYDFLWRIHRKVPPKGMIHIFNRSHYEDVLVPYIENSLPAERLRQRCLYLNTFEQMLSRENDTVIVKMLLHVSKEEQARRIEERESNPEKRWKFSPDDWRTHERYDKHVEAYHYVMEHCSIPTPWHIVPSDDKWYRNYVVAKRLVEVLTPQIEPLERQAAGVWI